MKTAGTTPEQRYFGSEGAAVYLGVTVDAVYTAVARRQIPFRWRGRKLAFDAVELDKYMHQLDGVGVDEAVGRRLHNGTMSGALN